MTYTERNEWIENLLATLVTLRVFGADFHYGRPYDFMGEYPEFIAQVSNRAPILEYFTIYDGEIHYWKQIRGEWVLTDEAGFLPERAFALGPEEGTIPRSSIWW